jgi:hypothetical protein
MKLIKFLLWLIIISLLATLVLQNKEYFWSTAALHLDLKAVDTWNWTTPQLPTGVYWAICFIIGLILTGFKALVIKFRLSRQIKTKDKEITALKDEINALKTELEVFKNDPYIKKAAIDTDTTDLSPEVPDEPERPDNEDRNPA